MSFRKTFPIQNCFGSESLFASPAGFEWKIIWFRNSLNQGKLFWKENAYWTKEFFASPARSERWNILNQKELLNGGIIFCESGEAFWLKKVYFRTPCISQSIHFPIPVYLLIRLSGTSFHNSIYNHCIFIDKLTNSLQNYW